MIFDIRGPQELEQNHPFAKPPFFGGSQKGGLQKDGLGGCSPVPKTGTRVHSDVPRHQKPETSTRVHADVPRYQKPERGYIRQTALLRNHPFVSSRLLSPLDFPPNEAILKPDWP